MSSVNIEMYLFSDGRVKVNGALTECITPMRGLWQGDPILSYLFLVCAALLNNAEARGELTWIKVCTGAPSINHLLFTDDSLLLLKIKEESAQCLQNILSLYEDCSGQVINKEKSSIMFNRSTSNDEKQELLWGSRVGKENFFQKLKKKFDKGGGTGYSHACDELF
jgi:hypothetical protein